MLSLPLNPVVSNPTPPLLLFAPIFHPEEATGFNFLQAVALKARRGSSASLASVFGRRGQESTGDQSCYALMDKGVAVWH